MSPLDFIPLAECVERGLYTLRSRNLDLGVFVPTDGGFFIGIREKFGSLFLDSEWHWEVPGGTARPTRRVGTLPLGIEMKERNPTVCEVCELPVKYERLQDPEGPVGIWTHLIESADEHKIMPVAYTYSPLFDFLEGVSNVTL